MRRFFYLPFFVLALGISYASPQTSPSSSTNQPSGQVKPSNPDNPGSQEQTQPPGAQSGGATQTQNTSPGNSTGGGIGSNTNAGTISATGTTTELQTNANESSISAGDLQARIQNALKNEPTLSSDSVNATVSEDQIDVSGAVASAKEKVTAKRIVQSYAGNRKVKDHLTVRGHGSESASAPHDTQNPASNPDKNKNNPRPGSQPPQPNPLR